MKKHYEHTMKSIIAAVLVFAMVLVSALSIPASVVDAAVAVPALSKTSQYVLMDDTYKLTVKNQVKGSTYTWTSSNQDVATVSKTGVVTGVFKGTATITCKVKAPKKNYTLKCKVTVISPASKFEISNKVTALNLGQKYDLNVSLTPTASNDKVTWTSSNTKIAKPDANGAFTALKKGTVTITGKTISGKKDSVTIKVVDAEGLVTTQDELNALVGTGIGKITIKTEAKVDLTIPEGNFSSTKLIVDAPKADVHNYGTFASIDIKNIAANSWYEEAVGNLLNILTTNSRIVVGENAIVKIEVSQDGAKLVIENNGTVQEVVVSKPADINVSGESKQQVPVVVNVPNIKITSSVPLALDCKQKIELVLTKGAEGTTVKAESKELLPTVKGDIAVTVTVGSGDNATQETTGGSSTGGAGGAGGGGSNSGGGNTTSQTYTITSLNSLQSIDVTYGGTTYNVTAGMLDLLRYFVSSSSAVSSWQGTNGETHTYNGVAVTVVAYPGLESDTNTKKVTLAGGSFGNGRSYKATIYANTQTVQITSLQSNLTFNVTMISNANAIQISPVPTGLTFTPNY